ncbi:MAG: pyridoxamine 5'-phosphate oxidase family protein [Burkholderiales bacterium]|nr:pyridoxamine 5'-phosphate oxidase family protein [Burkholderiales bacterium]
MGTASQASTLADVIGRYRFAYLMTTNAQGAPHSVMVSAVLQDDELVVSGFGRRTRENAAARPAVGVVWPPKAESEHSLIVDGSATIVGDSLRIAPTRAVLHRSAPRDPPDPSVSCGSDCVELGFGTPRRTP